MNLTKSCYTNKYINPYICVLCQVEVKRLQWGGPTRPPKHWQFNPTLVDVACHSVQDNPIWTLYTLHILPSLLPRWWPSCHLARATDNCSSNTSITLNANSAPLVLLWQWHVSLFLVIALHMALMEGLSSPCCVDTPSLHQWDDCNGSIKWIRTSQLRPYS